MMSVSREYAEHDLQLALTFAEAARDVGLSRIIYLGGLDETDAYLSERLSSASHRRVDKQASLRLTKCLSDPRSWFGP